MRTSASSKASRAAAIAGSSPGSTMPVTGVHAPLSERRTHRISTASGAMGRSQSIGPLPGAGRAMTAVVPGIHRGAWPTWRRSSRTKSGVAMALVYGAYRKEVMTGRSRIFTMIAKAKRVA